MRKNVFILFATLCFCATFASNAFAEFKVGIVDFMLAIEKTEKDGALKTLKADFDKRQNQLKAAERKIIAIEQDIKDNSAVLSEDKLRDKMGEYQTLVRDYQKDALAFEQELGEKRNKVLGKIQDKMTKISADIAKEKGLDIMIEKNDGAVIFSKSGMDYTDELITRYKSAK
ncbi:MAG: OmpH family outer membrane protein [Bradymonadales bacterium]|jgi:outer membrane protein